MLQSAVVIMLLLATRTAHGSACVAIQQLPVKLFNDAAVGNEVLHPAVGDAAFILKSICVEVVLTRCLPLSVSNQTPCQAPAGALEVHILSAPVTSDFHEDTLGIAMPRLAGGDRAAVFLSHVRETAARNVGVTSVSDVLGCALAHEIGHLLLHSASHSSEGVMRANLRSADLKKAAQRQLTFTAEQREAIR